MQKRRRSLAIVFWMAACTQIACTAPQAAPLTGPAQALTLDDARAAVVEADRAVRQAEAQKALWTTAEEALRNARHAMEAGDAVAARRYARAAIEQAELGIAQNSYPLFR